MITSSKQARSLRKCGLPAPRTCQISEHLVCLPSQENSSERSCILCLSSGSEEELVSSRAFFECNCQNTYFCSNGECLQDLIFCKTSGDAYPCCPSCRRKISIEKLFSFNFSRSIKITDSNSEVAYEILRIPTFKRFRRKRRQRQDSLISPKFRIFFEKHLNPYAFLFSLIPKDFCFISDEELSNADFQILRIAKFRRHYSKPLSIIEIDASFCNLSYHTHDGSLDPIVSEFYNLVKLNVSGNELTKISAEISSLKFLRILNVSRNKLVEIPESISYCKNLELLDISHNPHLKSLPKSLLEIEGLTVVVAELGISLELTQDPVLKELHQNGQVKVTDK